MERRCMTPPEMVVTANDPQDRFAVTQYSESARTAKRWQEISQRYAFFAYLWCGREDKMTAPR
jgi:hypothetical protein